MSDNEYSKKIAKAVEAQAKVRKAGKEEGELVKLSPPKKP